MKPLSASAAAASALPAATPLVEVAAGLIFRHGRLLLAQRPPGVHLAGLWEFPGGKRQPHESFEECLGRELREELGVEVEVRECLFEARHRYPEHEVRLRFFRCRLRAGEPRGLEAQRLAWVQPDDLAGYAFPPADKGLVGLLQRQTELWAR